MHADRHQSDRRSSILRHLSAGAVDAGWETTCCARFVPTRSATGSKPMLESDHPFGFAL
jgi:hypothetical protein